MKTLPRTTAQPERTPQRIGTSQLSYFIGTLRALLTHLGAQREQAFWDQIQRRCPELFAAIEADFDDDDASGIDWGTLLFEWGKEAPQLIGHNGKRITEQEGQL